VLAQPGMDYLSSLIKETLPASSNTYDSRPGKYIEKISPVIQQERLKVLQKPGEIALPGTEIYEEVTKISKPVK